MQRFFKSESVLEERINDVELRAYCVGFELNEFRIDALVELITSAIPDYAFGPNISNEIPLNELTQRLKEAAISVYTSDKFKRRGEFGEIILHILLRDFFGTLPLVSKIFFKDSPNENAKGFDAVHIHPGEMRLYVGESKIYKDGKRGVHDLVDDLKKHSEKEFLREEFMLVERKIPGSFPERAKWVDLIKKQNSLDNIFKKMTFAFTCTYESSLFKSHTEVTHQYLEDFKREAQELKAYFDSLAGKGRRYEIILFLLPVEDKDKLVEQMNIRLERMRKI